LFRRLVVERSQSGGYHVVYRCVVEIDGGVKLACGNRNGDVKTLIETRGEGNVILCAPSKGYALLQGDWKSLPIITREEREDLLTAAVGLNEAWKECTSSSELDRQEHISFRLRPGDDFNERGRENTRQILEMYGWKPVCVAANGSELWRRPGKDVGVSASLEELKDGIVKIVSAAGGIRHYLRKLRETGAEDLGTEIRHRSLRHTKPITNGTRLSKVRCEASSLAEQGE